MPHRTPVYYPISYHERQYAPCRRAPRLFANRLTPRFELLSSSTSTAAETAVAAIPRRCCSIAPRLQLRHQSRVQKTLQKSALSLIWPLAENSAIRTWLEGLGVIVLFACPRECSPPDECSNPHLVLECNATESGRDRRLGPGLAIWLIGVR